MASAPEEPASAVPNSPSTPPAIQPLPEGWEEFVTDEGDVYFHHAASGQTTWELPDA